MKILLNIFFLFFIQLSFACDCRVKSDIDIKDWNDTDIIFTGILNKVEKTIRFNKLTFSVLKVYKGKTTRKLIDFTVTKNGHHNLLDHIDIIDGKKWIIFSSSFFKNDNIFYKLKGSENSNYCMLSKPITDNDSYVNFAERIFKNPDSSNKNYLKGEHLFALGSLKNSVASGNWKYYTSQGLDYYSEGNYVNGKRHGKWLKKALNFKKKSIVLNEETYENGFLKERIVFNYINEKKSHEIYSETTNLKTHYVDNQISQKLTVDKTKNITLIENYKNGRVVKTMKKNLQLF